MKRISLALAGALTLLCAASPAWADQQADLRAGCRAQKEAFVEFLREGGVADVRGVSMDRAVELVESQVLPGLLRSSLAELQDQLAEAQGEEGAPALVLICLTELRIAQVRGLPYPTSAGLRSGGGSVAAGAPARSEPEPQARAAADRGTSQTPGEEPLYFVGGHIETEGYICETYFCPEASVRITMAAVPGAGTTYETVRRLKSFILSPPMPAGTGFSVTYSTTPDALYDCNGGGGGSVAAEERSTNSAFAQDRITIKCTPSGRLQEMWKDAQKEKAASDERIRQGVTVDLPAPK